MMHGLANEVSGIGLVANGHAFRIYIYIYIYKSVCVCICICIYIYVRQLKIIFMLFV